MVKILPLFPLLSLPLLSPMLLLLLYFPGLVSLRWLDQLTVIHLYQWIMDPEHILLLYKTDLPLGLVSTTGRYGVES